MPAPESALNISQLVLMITDRCNFHCSYCYQRHRDGNMSAKTLERALAWFLPRAPAGFGVFFLGGEPLLNADLIRCGVETVREGTRRLGKKARFFLTSNGSLLDDHWISWLNTQRFTVELSFDGPAQERCRKEDSFTSTLNTLEKLLAAPRITTVVSSVFAPETVDLLAESMDFLLQTGAPRISLGLDLHRPWPEDAIGKLEQQLRELRRIQAAHFTKTGALPLEDFPDLSRSGIWRCDAARDQLCVAPDGSLWGCALFYSRFGADPGHADYRTFKLGEVGEAPPDDPALGAFRNRYDALSQDHFFCAKQRCFLCEAVDFCGVCPMVSAAHSEDLRQVPEFVCRINRAAIAEKLALYRKIGRPVAGRRREKITAG